jgi:benzodiazapine receptor
MSGSNRLRAIHVANIGAFLLTVIVNVLANVLPLGGNTTAEISDAYPTLFAPAGYVFSIWGIIYTLQFVFMIYQALPKQRESLFVNKVGFLFVLSSLVNVIWLFLWHYEQIVLSVLPMFTLLGTLIAVYLRLQIGQSKVTLKEKLCVHVPFSVYLGWITVASIANVAAALKAANWDGFGLGDVTWTVLLIIAALIITLAVTLTRKDVAYSLVIVWALVGIIIKQIEQQNIVITAGIGVIAIVTALVTSVLRFRKEKG